jgi:short-subunit dehydrogenase
VKVVITGATAGIGAELARQYAAAGVTLGLTGRRKDRLDAVAEECRAKGATVHVYNVDVVDRPGMAELAKDFVAKAGGVDLVVANAGLGNPDKLKEGDAAPISALLEVNVVGVTNTLVPFIPTMIAQKSGQLAAVASIAGFRALPYHAGYCASKAAVQTLLDGFAMDLRKYGISCTCVNPGFIESEMTAKNTFPMPFILKTDEAVRRMRRAIARRKRSYTFPFPWPILVRLLRFLPEFIVRRLK